ncbi:uncharacterized protein BT62DRAFT_403161 [Guyanagaster necrorhizus]|uniref:Uncharacterized protein n=1 Tax=Guyanagaster necrorhizus TaxID=856835 RepID=A0A9P7W230_9AGAR|nr:uncharacterized protein BT62DRAFT_403161 [Guyanagaster necrorhizus MCA 3950]KAG7451164.1 hypothetical protein BT62DRAFT_403161 [Guyanagaster necrorhizus MCA 3950]
MSRRSAIPSLEASQQAHIDDLVQRNRSLEHSVKLIRDELDQEKARSKQALSDVHKRWKADQKEWREGVDVLLSCHRIALWRKTIDLQTERLNILKEEEDIRLGKISRLQRDFKITQFQQSESQYISRQELLEDEIQALNKKQSIQKEKWRAQSAELLARVQDREARVEAATTEVDRLSKELTAQREETARQKNMYQSTAPQMDRLRLQIEGAEAKQAELHRENDDLRRAKHELDRQLGKWQNLETKGGADMEKERKRRIELEAEVQALQNRLEKTKDKEKHKVDKLKESLAEWQTHAESEREAMEETKRRLDQTETKNAKLKAALEKERAKARSRATEVTTPKATMIIDEKDDEGEENVKSSSHTSTPQPQPKSRAKSNAAPKVAKVKTTEVESVEVEDILLGTTKGEGKGKATESDAKSSTSRSRSRSDRHEDSNIEEIQAPKSAPKEKEATTRKSKRKAASPDSVIEVEVPKARKRAGSEVKDVAPKAKRARSATVSRAGSVQPVDQGTAQTAEGPVKKARRKINIFPPPPTFGPAFDFGSQEGASSLNIPTALSPVKASEVPPHVSSFGSALSKYTGSIARRA